MGVLTGRHTGGLISASMMCADIFSLAPVLKTLEEYRVEYLHIDVMDGVFVPNYQLGTDYISQLRRRSAIPLDIHLMITKPEDKLDWFDIREGDLVSVHYESAVSVQRALVMIRQKGAKPVLALNPATPISVLEDSLPDVDAVLLMAVNPGFAGQSLIPQIINKISRLRNWLDSLGYDRVKIEADGNVSFMNAYKMRTAGADIFVAGTSSIFRDGMTTGDAITGLREQIK